MNMSDVYIMIASYLSVVVITVGFFAWFLKGFLGPFMKVRFSRGKLVLVRCRGMVKNHFHSGRVVESTLTYKGFDKQIRKINNITGADFEDIWGVKVIYLDEASSAIINGELQRNAEVKGGHDTVQTEQLIVRALTKPMDEDILKRIIIVCLALVFLALLFNGYMTYKLGPVTAETLRIVSTMNTTII